MGYEYFTMKLKKIKTPDVFRFIGRSLLRVGQYESVKIITPVSVYWIIDSDD